MTFDELRQRHPRLEYQSYAWKLVGDDLEISSTWLLHPETTFQPRVVIKGVTQAQIDSVGHDTLDLLAFHLGLAELPSYWKAACPAEILISAGQISESQIEWWQTLLIKGLGEFFFVNQLDFTQPDLTRIMVAPSAPSWPAQANKTTAKSGFGHTSTQTQPVRTLIPLGGGKDSALTLDLLKQWHQAENLGLFMLNPTPASQEIAKHSTLKPIITASRQIDPQLLELNNQGYLNGHTPISAYLGFLSITVAALFGFDQVAVSNERSSNEGNSLFHGTVINHQYSKTYTYETDFRQYLSSYFPATAVTYFSFLRPLYELQIGRLFSLTATTQVLGSFRSCNRGQKTNSWCGHCPKCLFAYLILFPFLEPEKMSLIFGHDLLDDISLREIALELVDRGQHKPLECVGMYEESLAAFYLSYQKVTKAKQPIPSLLAYIEMAVLRSETDLEQRTEAVLNGWNDEHHLPANLAKKLHQAAIEHTPTPLG